MSMLPVWTVKNLTERNGPTNRGKLGIECPACHERAVVSRKWAQPRMVEGKDGEVMIVGRSCTYCSKTAQVPARFKGGKERG